MQRYLPYNYDGSSCFMDSLLCALFFSNKLRVMDAYLLQGKRADTSQSDVKDLCYVLRVVAKCIRGSKVGTVDTYSSVRPLLAHYLRNLAGVHFEHGQHDPLDLFEALLRVCNVGGVFTTKKTVQSLYHTGRRTKTVCVDQMFRYSVSHSLTQGQTKFEAMFPSIETLSFDVTPGQDQEVLVQNRVIVEFGGGPIVVFTREVLDGQVHYGRWSQLKSACYVPILNTVEKEVQWYELQSVLCRRGDAFGMAGHYVCFLYDDTNEQWYFYNDMNQQVSGLTVPELVSNGIEGHEFYPPSETGIMFIYVKVNVPPSDVLQ